jgi:heme-degrading monooxygenase HmoA
VIVEHAMLRIHDGTSEEFETAFRQATRLIMASPGCRGVELRPAIEARGFYLLRIRWDNVASYRDIFRKSDLFEQCTALLGHFYERSPEVSYFGAPIIDTGVSSE